jgi:predicted DNA-binding transcriptional regulator YafY
VRKLLLKHQMENKPVEIIYLDQKGRITKRTIFVKKIDQDKVIAFCTLRDQNRTFDIENILVAQKGAYVDQQLNRPFPISPVPFDTLVRKISPLGSSFS